MNIATSVIAVGDRDVNPANALGEKAGVALREHETASAIGHTPFLFQRAYRTIFCSQTGKRTRVIGTAMNGPGAKVLRPAPARDRFASDLRMRTDDAPKKRAPIPSQRTAMEQAMSRKHHSLSKQLIVATAVALGASGVALADDSSMSVWNGDSYAYFNGGRPFPFGKPVFDKGPFAFRQTDPHGLSNAEYQALSADGRAWPIQSPSDPITVASMDAAKSWRQSHPHGLPISVYEAWSADGRPWPLPNAASPGALASVDEASASKSPTAVSGTGIARFFGFLRVERTPSPN